jgi:hypothetical protein
VQDWTPSTVTRELTVVVLTSDERDVALPLVLHYDVDDPYAVSATFVTGWHDDVIWLFARDLLRLGLNGATGQGDVRVWSSRVDGSELIIIALLSPDGEALLQVEAAEIADFLRATYALCPVGNEDDYLDLDRTLALLLAH